jgi:sialic acid synthase SpsE
MKRINVNNFEIGGENTYIIADIGSNHMQDLVLAKESIDAAAEAGANAIKFQSINLNKLYYKPSKKTRDFIQKLEFPEKWHGILNEYCSKKNITFFSSPTYLESVDLLEEINVPLYKLASAQIGTFPQLVERVAKINKPTIFSTGIATFDEVKKIVEIFKKNGNTQFMILHCNSIYPTPANRVNMQLMKSYEKLYDNPVGFSDHTIGTHISCLAVSMGAKIIEKHFTLDKNFETPDSTSFALNPNELKTLVAQIREIESAIKIQTSREQIEFEEKEFKNSIRYKLVTSRKVFKGEVINESNIKFLRTIKGIDCIDLKHCANKTFKNALPSNAIINYEDLIL